MKEPKFSIFFAFFSYGGNGGISSIIPCLRSWWGNCLMAMKEDGRIETVFDSDISETPISMTRNLAVQKARDHKADFLVMVDSDQVPDCHLGEPGAKPFLQSSLDFAIQHYARGPVMVAAPYCGPPPHENVYAFHWCNYQNGPSQTDHRLEQYTREHAAVMGGIQNCAAAPTGLTLWDMRCFDVLTPPYFYYEFRDKFETEKCSTEDVVTTRNLALAGCKSLGYNPCFINWDAWAGHMKPKMVEKPRVIHSDTVSQRLFGARYNAPLNHKMVVIGEEDAPLPCSPCIGDNPKFTVTVSESPPQPAIQVEYRRKPRSQDDILADQIVETFGGPKKFVKAVLEGHQTNGHANAGKTSRSRRVKARSR